MDTTRNRKLLVGGAAAAFVLGAGAVAGAAVGAGPFETEDSGLDSPSDTTEASTPATVPDQPGGGGIDGARTESTTFVDLPIGGTQTVAAGAAGFATVTRDADGAIRVVAVSPGAGWTFEVEPGDEPGEAEVDFRNGASRVQLNVELEDGAVRVRVRTRGAAATPTTGDTLPGGTLPDGTLPSVDNSGPGSNSSGPGSSGSGSGGSDDTGVDDHGGSGSSGPGSGGSDDPGGDDHGGSSGSGSSGSGSSGSDSSGSGSSGSGGGHGSDD